MNVRLGYSFKSLPSVLIKIVKNFNHTRKSNYYRSLAATDNKLQLNGTTNLIFESKVFFFYRMRVVYTTIICNSEGNSSNIFSILND